MKPWLFCMIDAERNGGNKIKGMSLIAAEESDVVLATKPNRC